MALFVSILSAPNVMSCEYLITVTPKTTQDITLGALKIETNSAIAKYRHQLAFFSISQKPEPEAAAKP